MNKTILAVTITILAILLLAGISIPIINIVFLTKPADITEDTDPYLSQWTSTYGTVKANEIHSYIVYLDKCFPEDYTAISDITTATCRKFAAKNITYTVPELLQQFRMYATLETVIKYPDFQSYTMSVEAILTDEYEKQKEKETNATAAGAFVGSRTIITEERNGVKRTIIQEDSAAVVGMSQGQGPQEAMAVIGPAEESTETQPVEASGPVITGRPPTSEFIEKTREQKERKRAAYTERQRQLRIEDQCKR